MAREIESTLLSLWLGAALLFGAVVAPNVFLVLRGFDLANANEIAGAIVTRTLAVINVGGFAVGLSSLATVLLLNRDKRGLAFMVELVSLALLTSTTGLGHWVVAARMRGLRAAMVTVDLVPAADPRRVSFNELHHYSVALLGVAACAAASAIIMSKRRARPGRSGESHA